MSNLAFASIRIKNIIIDLCPSSGGNQYDAPASQWYIQYCILLPTYILLYTYLILLVYLHRRFCTTVTHCVIIVYCHRIPDMSRAFLVVVRQRQLGFILILVDVLPPALRLFFVRVFSSVQPGAQPASTLHQDHTDELRRVTRRQR